MLIKVGRKAWEAHVTGDRVRLEQLVVTAFSSKLALLVASDALTSLVRGVGSTAEDSPIACGRACRCLWLAEVASVQNHGFAQSGLLNLDVRHANPHSRHVSSQDASIFMVLTLSSLIVKRLILHGYLLLGRFHLQLPDSILEFIVLLLEVFANFIQLFTLVLPQIGLNILALECFHFKPHGLELLKGIDLGALLCLELLLHLLKLLKGSLVDSIDTPLEIIVNGGELLNLLVTVAQFLQYAVQVDVFENLQVLHLVL